MECEKVRDRFSPLLENELDPTEERTVREHLTSCPDCQNNLEQFAKTMRWLHSVKDVEVPDGFLSELHKKMEERKRKAPFFPFSLKLPAQAVAMVAIVFLVLYLTKIMPFETFQVKEAKQARPPVSEPVTSEPITEEKKVGQLLAKKEKERVAIQPSFKEIEETRIPAPEPVPAPPEKKKPETALIAREKASPTVKPPQEIVLRTSDREKTLNQIQMFLQQFEGKMIRVEGNVFLASVPAASFSEFEKQLLGLPLSGKKDPVLQEKTIAQSDTVPAEAMRLRDEEQAKRSTFEAEQETHVVVRVLILEE
jgi:hypothetical protein